MAGGSFLNKAWLQLDARFIYAVASTNYRCGYTKMTNINLASNQPKAPQKTLVSIYWNYQTAPYVKIAENLLTFAESRGTVVNRQVYNNWSRENKAKQTLENLDFDCIDVVSRIDSAVDFQLSIDCGIDPVDIVIIVVGDRYGDNLIDVLQKTDKDVIVFGRKGLEGRPIKKLVDEFYIIDDLPALVADKTQPETQSETQPETQSETQPETQPETQSETQSETNAAPPEMPYERAIEHLLDAIEIVQSQGKATVYTRVCNQMLKRFPPNVVFSSITKPDGKKFSTFGKFVDAAVKDGRVRVKNQELFLARRKK